MDPDTATLVTIVVYYLALVAIGVACRKRTRDGADFFLAGRRLGPVVASLSASASSSSAWTLIGVSGYAYASGVSAVWIFPACVGGFALNWFLLAPALRRLAHRRQALTSTEILAGGGRAPPGPGPGASARALIAPIASLIILASLLTYVASQFQAAGKTFEATFGWAPQVSIVTGSAVVVLYTLLGGFWAVSLTDSLQGLLMAATAIVLPLAVVLEIGPGDLAAAVRAVDVEGFASPWRGLGPAAGAGLVAGLLGIGLGYPGQPHVVNRFMAMREGRGEMALARTVAMIWAVIVYAGMITLGLGARVLIDGLDGEKAMMAAADALFPPVVAGVMIAAVLSALMSTADSQLLVAASSVTHDLGLGGRSHRHLLVRSRLVVLGLSAGAVAAALFVQETVFSRVLFAWSSMGCAFGPLLLVTVLRGPVSAAGTIAAMTGGFGLSVAAYVAARNGALGPLAGYSGVLERIVPFAVALAIAWAASTNSRSR